MARSPFQVRNPVFHVPRRESGGPKRITDQKEFIVYIALMAIPQNSPNRIQGKNFSEISIVIPAFNEAVRIGRTLREVVAYLESRFQRWEVIVVDDGSSDGTSGAVRGVNHPAIQCLRNDANSGKGFSVRRGVLEARFDPILFSDADLSTPIEELERLLKPLSSGVDVVIASRRLEESQVKRSLLRRFLGWGFALLVSTLAVKDIRDTQCGFKLFRRGAALEIFPYQTIHRWGFDVELLTIARQRGFRVAEVPVRWMQSETTNVRFGTPLQMALELLRIYRNSRRGVYGPAAGAHKKTNN